jgi:hypothetical protein
VEGKVYSKGIIGEEETKGSHEDVVKEELNILERIVERSFHLY